VERNITTTTATAERYIRTVTTSVERDITTVTTSVERDTTTETGEVGEASAAPVVAVSTTEAQAPTIEAPKAETEARRPTSYVSVPPYVWTLARAWDRSA